MQPKSSDWKFTTDQRKPVYKSLAAELDAVKAGKKAISFFATDRSGLDDDLGEIEPLATKRGLRKTVAKRKGAIDIFVHRDDEESRIAPLQRLLSQSPWSFEHEAKLGELLGYTAAQRAAWLAAERHARPAFGVLTLYADTVAGYPKPLAWWSDPGRVPAPDAYTHMDKRVRGLVLWRVGVDPSYAKQLDRSGFVSYAGYPKIERVFDKAVRTSYERLGPTGWERVRRQPARRR